MVRTMAGAMARARATTSWWWGRQRCLGIVRRPTLTGAMLSQRRGGLKCLAIVGIPLLAGTTTSRRRSGQRCLGIVGRSLARSCDGGGGGQTTVSRFCTIGSGGRTKQWRWRRGRLSCLWKVGHPLLAHGWQGWRRRRLTAGQWWWCDQWRGNVSALLAVPLLAHATTSWRRGGQLWEVMGFLDDEAFAHH